MTQGMNKTMLIGNLGADPELRHTQSERAVLNFRIATTETFLDKEGNKKENTQWHTCVLWGPRAEGLSKYLHKGSRVYVEGRMEYREYEGKDGGKRFAAEVNVQNVILLDGAKKDDNATDGNRETRGGGKASGKPAASSNGKPKAAAKKDEEFSADADGDQIPF